ncbi:MAG TPA: HD domain-containing protein [Candidatus Limnocylindrales bacterium]|nr:HD domain-containing protein [Candidatus Limnocylindrales bacterium]
MSQQLKDFHHYKGSDLTKFEKVERRVIELILESKIPDEEREDGLIFELKHASGCTQIARILAQKRNLDVELSEAASTLHDIYVIMTGKYSNHGPLGAPIAEKILREVGGFTDDEIKIVYQAVEHHSEKEIHSDNPYIELVKDVDVLDSSLYKNAEGYYRIHKPLEIFEKYLKRIKAVRKELGLNPEEPWR